ncbi:hypothetical protein Drorol1_Dr00002104 [Drosera rotundifolia]
MGCCLSKKDSNLGSFSDPIRPNVNKRCGFSVAQMENKAKTAPIGDLKAENKKQEEEKPVKKKEVFVIQHRKSNDRRSESKCPSESDGSVPVGPISPDPGSDNGNNKVGIGLSGCAVVRTSSCTKEEVDAILIQCGRLSRSSSGKGGMSCENRSGRRYAGSKRSHDFDSENVEGSVDVKRKGGDLGAEDGACEDADDERHKRRSECRGSHRRRTPSRSRERDSSNQRSGSRERGMSSGRRVSWSPGRRSESPMVSNGGSASGMPGKMVSVPATVSYLSNDNGGSAGAGEDTIENGNVKRILVRRNVGDGGAAGSRGTASPRSQSPARGHGIIVVANESKGQQSQQVQSLSRNPSRKKEHSPYRRTPLNDIDMNSLPFQPLASKSVVTNISSKPQHKNKDIAEDDAAVGQFPNPASQNKRVNTSHIKIAPQGTHRRIDSRGGEGNEITSINYCLVNDTQPRINQQYTLDKVASQGTHRRTGSRGGEGNETSNVNYCQVTDPQPRINQQSMHEKLAQQHCSGYDALIPPVIISDTDTLRPPQTLTRSRSSRRSRDLDVNVEELLNVNAAPNYNSLLLQDIQKFHQKSYKSSDADPNTKMCTPLTHPPCLSKAYSILEAVADLNSSTSSNFSGTYTDDKQKGPVADFSTEKDSIFCFSANPAGKRRQLEGKEPVVESEVYIGDDLMAPSIHRYVTVRKKGIDDEEQESSGSNSFTGSQLNKLASASWEPNSADSTDCWTSSSRSNMRREEASGQLAFERLAVSEPSHRNNEEPQGKMISQLGLERLAVSDTPRKTDEEPKRKMIKNRRDSSSDQRSGAMRSRPGNVKGGPHGLGSSFTPLGAST